MARARALVPASASLARCILVLRARPNARWPSRSPRDHLNGISKGSWSTQGGYARAAAAQYLDAEATLSSFPLSLPLFICTLPFSNACVLSDGPRLA